MTLAAGTASITVGGNTLTVAPTASPSFHILRWNLVGDAESRTADVARNEGGVQAGLDLDGGRLLSLDVQVGKDTAANMLTARDSLAAYFRRTTSEATLRFSVDGSTEYIYLGQPRGADTQGDYGLPTRCEFLATDPRRFSGTEGSRTLGTHTDVTNAGTVPGIWRWEIAGPVTDPTLTIGTTTYTFSGLTVASGKTLVVSRRNRTVTVDGVSKTALTVDGDGRAPWLWADLPVGTTTISGTSGGVLYYRSAWA